MSSTATFEAKVPCGQPSNAASICPVWLQSSSIACLPRITRSGCTASTTPLRIFATERGSTVPSTFTKMPWSAPMASAVRIVSCACCGPIETIITSLALPASFRRNASSTAISSNGFIAIFTFESSTPEPSGFTRTFTLKSTTLFTATSTFIKTQPPVPTRKLSRRRLRRGPNSPGAAIDPCVDTRRQYEDARTKHRHVLLSY